MAAALHGLFLVLAPAGVLFACARVRALAAVGPVVLCYVVGIALATFAPGLLVEGVSPKVAEVAVPLSLPLLLLPTDVRSWIRTARTALLSFGVASVATFASALLFATWWPTVVPAKAEVTAMLVGTYIGGTPNMAAIALALGVDENVLALVTGADVLTGGAWLLFLVTVAWRLARWALPKSAPAGESEAEEEEAPGPKPTAWGHLLALGFGVAAVGVSAGLSLLAFGEVALVPVLLLLTLAGLGGSFVTRLRRAPEPPLWGEYLLLVFCVAIGAQVDLRLLAAGSPVYLLACAATMAGAATLHLMMARVLKLDADTVVITSTAAIFGPPFVPPVARAMGNPKVIPTGVAMGLCGYAVGTWMGLLAAYILQ